MSWIQFSNYRKRIWDINFEDTTLHLIFIQRTNYGRSFVEVRWRTGKFKGVGFNFFVPYKNQVSWKLVFSKLRISLAHGLNQNARAVTDILLQVDANKPHPIHNMTRTSKAI